MACVPLPNVVIPVVEPDAFGEPVVDDPEVGMIVYVQKMGGYSARLACYMDHPSNSTQFWKTVVSA